MGDVRRAFSGRDDDGEDGDNSDLREAFREVKRAVRERKHTSGDESRRIVEILRRAAADIIGKQ